MKKILFAAMALGMTMTSCMNDEFPNATRYGYINLNVSNDPVMVTRTTSEPNWIISATKDGAQHTGIVNGANKVPAGEYTISAKSHTDEATANTTNTYGAPFYSGEVTKTVSAGKTVDATIECGQAKNSKLTLVNNLNTNVFKEVKLNATQGDRKLSLSNDKPSAFYSKNTSVSYNISYKYNGSTEVTTINNNGTDYTITIEDPAKDYQIKLTSTDNGNINVTITYNDEFGSVNSGELNIDAATGNKAE